MLFQATTKSEWRKLIKKKLPSLQAKTLLLQGNAIRTQNARAMYQRLMNKMFAHQIGRNVQVYVDDILIKII